MLQLMINDQAIALSQQAADTMLLNFLREQRNLVGTKEGCASGDCGACTVVMVSKTAHGKLSYQQINSCITPLHSLHSKQIITVEYLKQGQQLHPVQQAVVDKHGSQCGFCTPGFVMSLYALSRQKQQPEHPEDYLAGNLCRCTGYGPLIEAAQQVAAAPAADDHIQQNEAAVQHWMGECEPLDSVNYWQPNNRQELAEIRQQHPDAKWIGGGTDLALEVTQLHQRIPKIIDLTALPELSKIERLDGGWRIGAAVPLSDVHTFMQQHYPTTDEIFARLGSITIRHRATLGGSLGNASPIGDIAPLLISLNGKIELDDGYSTELYAPEDYITGYRETRLKPEQWISAIHLPDLDPDIQHQIYKVSKRYEDDIATVVLAVALKYDSNKLVSHCVISAGGVAAKSVRLAELENCLLGETFTPKKLKQLQALVPQFIKPIDDVRASAAYRVMLVQNLLKRFYLYCHQLPTRLAAHA
ncbi:MULTISPECIES: xanthine dehydrogenase small subunit [unclassified Agarivorans]|uniref:xanthine dehydrogenase small subunit n=1 Tax=unclassified Agarivorans TaxID=2636026 RepID=UPI0026E1B02B|nr:MULTISPECIES: xanthine dehydrogenase small subunit [unclassified Agarivorans]MDO6687071.1 xanthine dehydrogenase small subunit [Agarivorans sp. 3_MG-2023]MDO6713517.1 xanthine dehydrogenase small subunit [Agarivorans sp. 2_MG-2023]